MTVPHPEYEQTQAELEEAMADHAVAERVTRLLSQRVRDLKVALASMLRDE